MRSGSKRLMIGFGTLVIAVAMAGPSMAAKSAVSDDELDQVTAAGQPVIIQAATGALTAAFTPSVQIAQSIQTNSQNNLRALALNNVAGENQVANGINVSSGASEASQSNAINQSWGSTADVTWIGKITTKATVSLECNAGALICQPRTVTTSQSIGPARLVTTADVIIDGGDTSSVTYNPTTNVQMQIDGGAQTNLVALVVNNVAGLNQVSTGINVLGSSTTLGTGSITINPAGFRGGDQNNALGAFRGTPANTFGFAGR
jgi:hypothetical protein